MTRTSSLFRAAHSEERNAKTVARRRLREEHDIRPRGTGGADRVRTDDLRLAKPALSQLSYSPQPR
jgi:hypothetical protein